MKVRFIVPHYIQSEYKGKNDQKVSQVVTEIFHEKRKNIFESERNRISLIKPARTT
jgi:hypothetical protein